MLWYYTAEKMACWKYRYKLMYGLSLLPILHILTWSIFLPTGSQKKVPVVFGFSHLYFSTYLFPFYFTTYSFLVSWCFGCSWKYTTRPTVHVMTFKKDLEQDNNNPSLLRQSQPEKKVHVSTADGSNVRIYGWQHQYQVSTSTDTYADTSCMCVYRTFFVEFVFVLGNVWWNTWENYRKSVKNYQKNFKSSSALVLAATVYVYQVKCRRERSLFLPFL